MSELLIIEEKLKLVKAKDKYEAQNTRKHFQIPIISKIYHFEN